MEKHASARAVEVEGVAFNPPNDLRKVRIAALAFRIVATPAAPVAIALALDEDGEEHCLAARVARHGAQAAYLRLFEDLLSRGLRASRRMLVDAGGSAWLARRIEHAFGPVALTATAS
jgi:hypothetical protein